MRRGRDCCVESVLVKPKKFRFNVSNTLTKKKSVKNRLFNKPVIKDSADANSWTLFQRFKYTTAPEFYDLQIACRNGKENSHGLVCRGLL